MAVTSNGLHEGTPQITETAFRSMIRVSGLLRRVMDPYFSRFGISASQWGVLRNLHRAEGEGLPSLRVTDLSSRLLVQPPSTTGVLDRLQRMGLVQRKPCTDDQRARQVSLTAAGRQLVERVLEGHSAHIAGVMAGLPLVEQQMLKQLMDKLAAHLEVVARQAEPFATVRDEIES